MAGETPVVTCLGGTPISGRHGLNGLVGTEPALTWHKLLHAPLLILGLSHLVPAILLAFQRWGWRGRSRAAA